MLTAAPFRLQVPLPTLIKETAAAVLFASNADKVLIAVLVPPRDRVRVAAAVPYPGVAVFVKLIAPEPDASREAPMLGEASPAIVKLRFVETAGPVYLKIVPFPSIKLIAAFVDWPMLLGLPPSARVVATKIPA